LDYKVIKQNSVDIKG